MRTVHAPQYFPTLLIGLFAFLLLLVLPTSAWAVTPAPERIPLTLELLQERLKSPIQSEGVRTIDLRQLIINLRSENAEFRDQFYQLVQTQLNRSETPLGLDFSHSIIQGELIGSKLGLRTPLHGEALSPLLTPDEQQQLLRDPRQVSPTTPIPSVTVFRGAIKLVQTRVMGTVNFANTFFLNRVEASGAIFTQEVDCSETRWIRSIDFSDTTFGRDVNFSGSLFLAKAGFTRAQFRGVANFPGSTFEEKANFSQAQFTQVANFVRSLFHGFADFTQTRWHDRALFSKSRFTHPLLLTEATFEKAVAFRETQFNQLVNLRSVSLLEQVDFSNIRFLGDAYLNVAGLTFDSDQAKIFGDTGEIGRRLSVPMLQGNEDVLRNLVRNFRSLQQIADANQLEYRTQRLRRQQLEYRLISRGAGELRSGGAGERGSGEVRELGSGGAGELRSRGAGEIGRELSPIISSPLNWILDALSWLGLSLLLLLSQYGTSFWMIFGVGLVAIAYFGLLFWLVDRFRRRHPQPIVPSAFETPWMLGSYGIMTFAGVTAIFRTG
ncbi:MAG: pentapeptide repeat-containing protein, partial [Cyanobacteriota bacterium]